MAWNSELVSLTYHNTNLVAGESHDVTIQLKNTSNNSGSYDVNWWRYKQHMPNTSDPYSIRFYHYLAPLNQTAKQYTGIDKIILPETIWDNSVATLNFSMIAPVSPGTYTFQYQMVYQYGYWTGQPGQFNWYYQYFGAIVQFNITVLARPNAEIVTVDMPDSLYVADRYISFVTLKNTGPWPWNYEFRIEAINEDAGKFSKSWYYVPVDKQIAPGQSYTFQIPMRAPPASGTYNPRYQMYWPRALNFGDIVTKQIGVTMPESTIQNLNDYNWLNLSARRSTSDIAWQYDVNILGTDIPPTFGKLTHVEDNRCALLGYPTDYRIDYDYPDVTSQVTAYSSGYFLSNRAPWYIRQTRAGADIKAWQKTESNISAIQGRLDKITTFENPSHYIARMLFYVDDATGLIDETRPGPYGLWATKSNSAITGGMPSIRAVPNWNIEPTSMGFDNRHPTLEEPAKIEGKQFGYDGDKLIDILDEVSEHCHMIYFTRFILVGTEWREYFYLIPKFGVALGWLGVTQTPIQITPQTAGLIGSPGLSASIVLEQSYNSVWVEACRKKDSTWFYKYLAGSAVVAGLEIPRTLYYRTYDLLPDPAGNWWINGIAQTSNFGPGGKSYGTAAEDANAQALVDAKANQLLSLLEYQIPTFEATFQDLAFELYQVVVFSGFEGLSNFNATEMQIIDIQYDYSSPADGGHTISITCAPKAQIQASGKFQSVIDEIQENYEKFKEDVGGSETDDKLAVILHTYDEGSMCTAQLRSTGALVKTRTYGYRTSNG